MKSRDHANQGASRKSLLPLSLLCLLTGAASGCGAPTEQAEKLPVASSVQSLSWLDVFSDVFGISSSILDVISDARLAEEVKALSMRMSAIEVRVRGLETDMENMTYAHRRAEAINLMRDVDAQRAGIQSALKAHRDYHPADSDALRRLSEAADALSMPSFYTFAGRTATSPDRFEHRGTLPTFILAVTSWIGLHQAHGLSWTTGEVASLRAYASWLDYIRDHIRYSVKCIETQSERAETYCECERRLENPGPTDDHCCTVDWTCVHSVKCTDSIDEKSESVAYWEDYVRCDPRPFEHAAWTARWRAPYGLDNLKSLADRWRTVAGP